jgi:hypothetical protein
MRRRRWISCRGERETCLVSARSSSRYLWPAGSGRSATDHHSLSPPFGPTTADCLFLLSRELKRETTWARIHLVPLLLAEGDRAAHQEGLRATAVETEIMKDVKGWVVSNPCLYNVEAATDLETLLLPNLSSVPFLFLSTRPASPSTITHDTVPPRASSSTYVPEICSRYTLYNLFVFRPLGASAANIQSRTIGPGVSVCYFLMRPEAIYFLHLFFYFHFGIKFCKVSRGIAVVRRAQQQSPRDHICSLTVIHTHKNRGIACIQLESGDLRRGDS